MRSPIFPGGTHRAAGVRGGWASGADDQRKTSAHGLGCRHRQAGGGRPDHDRVRPTQGRRGEPGRLDLRGRRIAE